MTVDGPVGPASLAAGGMRHQCDIVLTDYRVVVEYDGWFWHAPKVEQDTAKSASLQDAGWTVIRIRERPLEMLGALDISVEPDAALHQVFAQLRRRLLELQVPVRELAPSIWRHQRFSGSKHDDPWHIGFEALHTHVMRGGSVNPPALFENEDGFRLGQWVQIQRRAFRRGLLSPKKIDLLKTIPGWAFTVRSHTFIGWDAALLRLTALGHLPTVTYVSPDGFKLGRWASYQRSERRKGRLPPERIELLSAIPYWQWEPTSANRAAEPDRLKSRALPMRTTDD